MPGPNDDIDDFDPHEYTREHSTTAPSNSSTSSCARSMTSVVAIGVGVAAAAFLVSNSELDHILQVSNG
jgi:hypothetical protein